MPSYREMRSKYKQVIDSGNIKKKAKLLYFTSRDKKTLDCLPYELYNLNENLNFDLTQEFFTIRDVAMITDKTKNFFTFRGFNFSTKFKYDKTNKVFQEKKYDDKYMSKCRASQYLSRILGTRLKFDFNDLELYF